MFHFFINGRPSSSQFLAKLNSSMSTAISPKPRPGQPAASPVQDHQPPQHRIVFYQDQLIFLYLLYIFDLLFYLLLHNFKKRTKMIFPNSFEVSSILYQNHVFLDLVFALKNREFHSLPITILDCHLNLFEKKDMFVL